MISYNNLDQLLRTNENTIIISKIKNQWRLAEFADMIVLEKPKFESNGNQTHLNVRIQNEDFIIENQFIGPEDKIEVGSHLYGPVVYDGLNVNTNKHYLRAPVGLTSSKSYKGYIFNVTNDINKIKNTGRIFNMNNESFEKTKNLKLIVLSG